MDTVIVVVGPTASGKSALGVEIARAVGGEVISADSRQVYRGLDIGSGKITKREMKGVPHHLLDVASPKSVFTASDFVRRAEVCIEDIVARGKVPIVCGGTGFYIDALLGRVSVPEVQPNLTLRKKLESKTPSELFALLKKKDPLRAAAIDQHNPRRLVRALEIAHALGVSPEAQCVQKYRSIWIGITHEKGSLQSRIHSRLLARMRVGMVAEARRLHESGLTYKRMESLGLEYRHLAQYLRGTVSKDEMLAKLELYIGNYAKRQVTYWKRNADIHWIAFGPDLVAKGLEIVTKFIPSSQVPKNVYNSGRARL